MNPYLHFLSGIGPMVFWTFVLIAIMVSLCAAVIALRIPRRAFVITSAAALAVAVLLVAVPHPQTTALVSALIGVAALAVSVAGGGPVVLFVLAMASRGSVADGAHGGILIEDKREQQPASPHQVHEVLRGGTTIGVFERFATTASIMAGFPEAIAVLVAIKGVGRFTELDAAEARERFIIGTLVSLVWAAACGAVFRLALG
jgi:hypothetical protein